MKTLMMKLFSLRFLGNFPKGMLIPFFAVWLIHQQSLSPMHAASVVGSYIIMYRAGALLFSSLLAKHSAKLILIFALLLVTVLHALLYIFGFGAGNRQ